APQLLVELPLQAAQTLIVGANITQDLRRQFALGIKALGFFLKVDALQIQRTDALNHFRIGLACHPAESLVSTAVRQHNSRIVLSNACNQADGISEIGSFRRHDERRVHLDRHRQFTPRAIVDDAALRRKIEAPLLLVLGAALEIAVAENLKINQPQTDRQQPEAQESRQDVEPESCAVRRGTCRHFSSQFSVLSSQSEIVSFSLRTENWELRTALLR